MKKIFKCFFLAVIASLALGCQKPDQEPIHTDNLIREILMYSTSTPEELDGLPLPQPVRGVINQETGQIRFPIPKDLRPRTNSEGKRVVQIDPSKVKLRATVGYDVKITPSLTGIHDLSEQDKFSVDVLAVQTGEIKHYTMYAYFSRN